MRRYALSLIAVLCAASFATFGARADDVPAGTWPVDGRLRAEDGAKSRDISGIACMGAGFPRGCLVIDDNRQSAQFATLEDGRMVAGDDVRLIDDKFDGEKLDLDGEGIAVDGNDFYVLGSHGRPRHTKSGDHHRTTARIAASSKIVRVRLRAGAGVPLRASDVAEVRATSALRPILEGAPLLAPYVDAKLDENGLTAEGIAVRDGRMFIGFRGPVLPGGAALVLSASLATLFDGAPSDAMLSRLQLGDEIGIRDLVPWKDGLLVLAGPVGDEGPYSLHYWDVAGATLRSLGDITNKTEAAKHRKPEGLVPLESGPQGLRVLILFDNVPEGGPLPIVVPDP